MDKQDFKKRILSPVALLFAVMSGSWGVYNLSWRLPSDALHGCLAVISGTLLFLSVAFGALFVYPIGYFRGASFKERIAVSLVNPFIWMTKENIRLSISYSFAECLYYYLNPLNIFLLSCVVTQMGLAEMFCRWRLATREPEVRVLGPGPLAAFLIGLSLATCLLAWGRGENAYVLFLSGYRKIFGSGL